MNGLVGARVFACKPYYYCIYAMILLTDRRLNAYDGVHSGTTLPKYTMCGCLVAYGRYKQDMLLLRTHRICLNIYTQK